MYLSQDELSCPVCFEPYDPNPKSKCLPKTLPGCGHTLCSKCLYTIIKDKRDYASCPIDKKRLTDSGWRTVISESTVDSRFPTNYLVISLLNKMASQDEPSQRCVLHKKPLDLFCFTEKEIICKECSETSHLGHKAMPIANIQDLAQQRKKQLETLLSKSKTATNEVCKVLKEKRVNLLQQKAQDKLATFKKLLNEKLERAQTQIDKECSQKEELLKAQSSQNNVGIQDQIDKLSLPLQNSEFIEAYENPSITQFCQINQEDLEDFYRMLIQQIDGELDQVEVSSGPTPEISAILLRLKLCCQEDWLMVYSTEKKALCRNSKPDRNTVNIEEASKFSKIGIELPCKKMSSDFINTLKLLWEKLDSTSSVRFNVLSKEFQDEDLLTLCSYSFWSNENVLSFELDLANTLITDKSINQGLAGSLQKMVNLKQLKISFKDTKISDQCLEKLSKRSVCSMPCLEDLNLDFTGTSITSDGIVQFSYYLKSAIQNVKRFKLVLSNTKIQDEGLIGIADYLLPQLKEVQNFELCLFNTSITNSSVIHLSNVMKTFKDNITSFTLVLSSNSGITDTGLEALAKNTLSGMNKLEALNLYLRKTGISDLGVNTLANSLKDIVPNLKTFDLVLSNTKVTDQSLKSLSENVFNNFKTLQNFELSLFETQVTDVSLDHLYRHMTNNLESLQKFHLMLSLTNVSDFGIATLGTMMLPKMQNLQSFELSLRDTKVNDDTVITLSENIKNLKCLKNLTLVLNSTKITDKGLEQFVQNALERPTHLETLELNLGITKVTDKSVSFLCDTLAKNAKGMKAFKLNISHTKVAAQGISSLCKLLQSMDKLEDFGLELCQVPLEGETATRLFLALEGILPDLKRMKVNSVNITDLDSEIDPVLKIRELMLTNVQLYTRKFNNKKMRAEYLEMQANTAFSTLPSRGNQKKNVQPQNKTYSRSLNQRRSKPISYTWLSEFESRMMTDSDFTNFIIDDYYDSMYNEDF